MSAVCYNGPSNLIDIVEKDGYFLLKNFFDREAVEKARAEMKVILDKDENRRKKIDGPAVDSSVEFRSIYTKLMHTIWFPSLQSQAYLNLANDMFSAPVIKSFIKELCGDNLRTRIDLIRRSSGANDWVDDFQLPHVWHRDTLGEFTFGIFFDDMPEKGSGGTAVIPGTHWDQRDPRWDLMLGPDKNFTRMHHLGNRELLYLPENYVPEAKLNARVARKANKKKVELSGQMGDIYFFLNDAWHGRAPNMTEKRWMISRIGCFATDFPFKDDIPLNPGAEELEGPMGEHYNRNQTPNTQPDTLLRRMAYKRKANLLTRMAAREKDMLLTKFYSQPDIADVREAVLDTYNV